MKHIFYSLLLTAMPAIASAQAPAFPGAEGHGRYVTGGRGGKVIHVTNLNDKGVGSFRAAVNGDSKKIIVFDVAGVIALQSDLDIGKNTTILGQTAPSPGVTFRYYTMRPSENNIIRFIRVRRGQEKDVNDGADTFWQRKTNGIIIDHCSFSWSIDEIGSFYDNNNFTMQWCVYGESLVNAGHDKGSHGYGGIWGGKLASFHHNMIAHVANRSPRFNGARYQWTGYTSNTEYSTYKWANYVMAENVDFRNCFMYNYDSGSCYGGPGGGHINMVNNYYDAAKSRKTTSNPLITQVSFGNSGNSTPTELQNMSSRYYISGNYTRNASGTEAAHNWDAVGYDVKDYKSGSDYYSPDPNGFYKGATHEIINSVSCVKIKLDEPIPTGLVTTHSAKKAREKVISYAGASLYRDEVDERYMSDATNRTVTYKGSVTGVLGRIDLVSDVNGYTEENFPTGSRPAGFDSDNDGIPDEWETANGLNPKDASDAATYTLDSKGYYTNLEVYANSLVEDIMKAENEDADDKVDEYYPTVATGISQVADAEDSAEVKSVEYFGIDGSASTANPVFGVDICRVKYANGKVTYNKVIKE